MVTASYMTKKAPEPGALQRFFDWRVLPVAINAAGGFEVVLSRWSERARRQPWLAAGAAVACGFLLRDLVSRRSARSRARLGQPPRQAHARHP